jgi:hypothetical protein
MRSSRLLHLSSLGLLAAACSSGGGGSGGATTTAGTGGHATTSTSTHHNVCVLPTDKGNSIGVGKYCTPGGNECMGLGAGLCTADVAQDEWFCVKVGCQMDSDCAEMAMCVKQSGSSGCVPDKCLSGGTDGGTDSGIQDAAGGG